MTPPTPNQSSGKKITEEAVIELLKKDLTINFYPLLWSSRMIADHFKTSLYQVRKILKVLKQKGIVEYVHWWPSHHCYESCDCEYEYSLPIWGNRLTKKSL